MLLPLSPEDEAKPTGTRTGPPRHWRVPPALLRNTVAAEMLDGVQILAEHSGEVGLLLWQCYRDVLLWADTPPDSRAKLFDRSDPEKHRELIEPAAAAGLDPEILRAVRTLHKGLRKSSDNGSMVSAALSIAAASEPRGAGATAMGYAQLAAATAPTAAAPALAVGQVAARVGHSTMAEAWLRRSIGLARRSGEWESYGGALTILARMREAAGRHRDARVEYRKALRLARRHSLYEARREALAGLLRLALCEEDQPAAERYARSIFRMYGRDHPDRGRALLDVAETELRKGRHARASTLLHEALRSRIGTGEQVRALTMLVRAEGGAGDREMMQAAWQRALDLIDTYSSTSAGARLLLALARAGAEVLEDRQGDVVARVAWNWATRLGGSALADECAAFLSRPRLPPGPVGG